VAQLSNVIFAPSHHNAGLMPTAKLTSMSGQTVDRVRPGQQWDQSGHL